MTEQTIRTADQAIRSAIDNTTANTLTAVFSIIESYKTLMLNPEAQDAYDAGKRDAIEQLTVHLRKFESGLVNKDEAR